VQRIFHKRKSARGTKPHSYTEFLAEGDFIALIFVGGIKVMKNALFTGGILALSSLDLLSVLMFIGTIFIIQKWKPNPVIVILGGGVAGGIVRLILNL
jgi:hypothetical protein